jgi:hypothetical protein
MKNYCIGLSTADLREGSVKESSNFHISWAKESCVSIGSAGGSYNENNRELFNEFAMTQEIQARNSRAPISDANEIVTNPQASNVKGSMHTVGQMWCIPEANSVGDVMCTDTSPYHRSVQVLSSTLLCATYLEGRKCLLLDVSMLPNLKLSQEAVHVFVPHS